MLSRFFLARAADVGVSCLQRHLDKGPLVTANERS